MTNYMAGFERLKARGTAGFKRNVRTKPTSEARLNAYLADCEREHIRKHGVRKLKFIGRREYGRGFQGLKVA